MIENALLTSFLYFAIVFLMAFTYRYVKGFTCKKKIIENRISAFEIVVYSVLFTLLNGYLTRISLQNGMWTGDRGCYFYSFLIDRSNSVGLDFVYNLARFFSWNFYGILYTTTFICCILFFTAYNKNKNASVVALLFFLFTDVIFLTFAQLKQCYAIGFSSLFFSFIIQERKNNAICLVFATLAACFHVTGFILFPLYFIIRIIDLNGKNFKYIILLFILLLWLMYPILHSLSSIFFNVFPGLSTRIVKYFFDEYSSTTDGSWLVFVKGFPFYIVTVFSLIRRETLSKIYVNYDVFVVLSIIGSCLYLLSIVSYWMFRFTALFYMPVAILFGMIVSKERDVITRFFLLIIVFVILIIVRIRHIILTYINFGGY